MPTRRSLLLRSALTAAALATGLATGSARAGEVEPRPYDRQTYEAALDLGAPMLVEIFAPWCPTCRAQREVLADLLDEPRFSDLVRLEVDFDGSKDVVRALGANRQSTLIVYAGGAEVARAVGETRPEAIAALVGAAY